jgi:acetolactate decarboxylase
MKPHPRRLVRLAWVALGALALAGCGCPPAAITQYSTLDALLVGVYDGEMTVGELRRAGDIGLGTFNALDGEMVMLDGVVYQVPASGGIRPMGDATKIPFAMVAARPGPGELDRLVEQGQAIVMHLTAGQTLPAFDSSPRKNYPWAIVVTGRFARVKTRSVHRQHKPYPPLSQAVANQVVWQREDVRGTLVGFYMPACFAPASVGGLHLHFLSEDKSFGGHVLEYELAEGTATLLRQDRLDVTLPATADYAEYSSSNPAAGHGASRPAVE